MRDSHYRITLDITETQSQVSLSVKQGDTSRKIYISLVEGLQPYEIDGTKCIAVFHGKKADGTNLEKYCIIEGNKIRYDFTEQTTAAPGLMECDITLHNIETGVVATPHFSIIVDDRAIEPDVLSEDEVITFDEVITQLGDIRNAESGRVSAEEERVSNEQIRITNEETRNANEEERIANEETRKKAAQSLANLNNRVTTAENERETAEAERQEAEKERQAMWNNSVENPKVWELNPGCYYVSGMVSISSDVSFPVYDKTVLYIAPHDTNENKKRFVLFLGYSHGMPFDVLTGTTDGVNEEWHIVETDKNKTNEINGGSSYEQYPSAKAVYELFSGIEIPEIPENIEKTDNKVKEITEKSTDEQYPSAKAVFDLFSTVEAPGDDTAKCECVGFEGAFTVTPKYKPFTRIINNCQNTADWNTHSLSNCETDAENYVLGNQSIHSTNGAMVCMKNTYDMLNNSLVLKLRINSIATGANLYLQIFNTGAPSKNVVYNLMRGASTTPVGEWREITVPYTGYSWGAFDSIDFSNINYLRIYAEGNIDWNLQSVGTRPVALDKGIVTFTFDDGYASQGKGLKILAEKGITGTLFYVPESNSNGSDDYLKISDLKNLSNYYGTDIEVHGASSYNDKTNEELIAHWQEAQALLKENGLGDGRYMSYPNNMHENRVVQLAKGFFDGCRTIQYYIPSETYPPADNYRVRAISSISSAPNCNNVANIKNHIDRAMASKSWLILTFHRIEDGNTSMYCSESELSEIADYAIASGAYIMNYAEVMESSVVNTSLGNISKALDGIIDIQNNLIGGAEG